MLRLVLGVPGAAQARGFPPKAPRDPTGQHPQTSGTVAECGAGWWQRVAVCPLGVGAAGVEAAAARGPLQPRVGSWEPCWVGGPPGTPLSWSPSLTVPGSVPGTRGWAAVLGDRAAEREETRL